MLKNESAMLTQYQSDGKRGFFKALQEGRFSQALEIMDNVNIDPDIKGGLLSASALFYVATSGDLEPSFTERLLKKGANPNLKCSGFEEKTVLEEVIHTGFFYYTSYRMYPELKDNFLKTIKLLAASGGTCRENLLEDIIQKSPLAYDVRMDYRDFTQSIFSAIQEGQAIFTNQQEEKSFVNGPERSSSIVLKRCWT